MINIKARLIRAASGLLFVTLFSSIRAQNIREMQPRQIMPLDGIWKFKLDPFFTGISSNGVQLMPSLPEEITLPGSTDQAGKGSKTQGMSSLRLTRAFEYKGAAWYEKEVYVPGEWKGKTIQLFLERAHWQTALWINGMPAGTRESLSVPHVYDLTKWIKTGAVNTIRIRVNNDLIYNLEYSHAISAETQTNWNGIIGRIELQAFSTICIGDVQTYPDPASKSTKTVIQINNPSKNPVKGVLHLNCDITTADRRHKIRGRAVGFSGSDSIIVVEAELPLGEKVYLWDEFHPTLYQLNVQLEAGAGANKSYDSRSTSFGLRTISTKGTRFFINGQQTFIRSTVNSAEFPLTGYPDMDTGFWLKVFKTCKDYGLNAMRFHSWCPPEAAFDAADKIGMYLQIENSDWRFTIGKDSATNQFLSSEADRILNIYGNHPSFVFFCEGNELVGPKVKTFLSGLVSHWKKTDPRHLYTGSSGYPVLPEDDYEDFYGARPQHWKEGLKGRFNIAPLQTLYDYSDDVAKHKVPMITHEIGQWCVYPNFNEIPKYKGVLKPYNYELFRELLRNRHLLDQANEFTMASGKFQVIQKKEEIESYLRTPGFGGYTMLQLNDYPGQGTAPVGVVDVFWDSKPYVTAEDFRKFQGPRVPLLRTGSFTWTNDQDFKAVLEFANFGPGQIDHAIALWTLTYPDGKVYAQGKFDPKDIPLGSPIKLGDLSVSLNMIQEATRLDLTVGIEGMNCSNQWAIWVYPKQLPAVDRKNVLVAYNWDQKAKNFLQKGGTVLLLADTAQIALAADPVFSGISWNTVWSGMPPNMLGILCDPGHPALKNFPTQSYSNWQWWDIVRHSAPIVLDSTKSSFKPLIQLIPDWNNPRKIGLVVEAKVGKGRLLISAVDLRHHMHERMVARQLLYSLERYAASKEMDPSGALTVDEVDRLFKK